MELITYWVSTSFCSIGLGKNFFEPFTSKSGCFLFFFRPGLFPKEKLSAFLEFVADLAFFGESTVFVDSFWISSKAKYFGGVSRERNESSTEEKSRMSLNVSSGTESPSSLNSFKKSS